MEVYFCRKLVGSIDSSQVPTLGDLIIKTIDLVKNKYPKLNFTSGTKIIDFPPPHSNCSFLFLGRRERYITSFSLVQIDLKKNISLDSAIYRTIDGETIPDISYKSAEKIYFFHRLPDWHRSTYFDQTQTAILKSHHQFLKTRDRTFRTENQTLRQNLAKEIRIFIVPTAEDNDPILTNISGNSEPDSTISSKWRALETEGFRGATDNSHVKPIPPKVVVSNSPPLNNQLSAPSALPGFSSGGGSSSKNFESTPSRSGGAIPGFIPQIPTVKIPKENIIQANQKVTQRSIIDTLNDPLGIMDPISEPEDQTQKGPSLNNKLDHVVKEIRKVQEAEDYQMAQALHLQINNSPPPVSDVGSLAIQRLIEKGIAVNALTGH
uniref:Uncharacterized protein n=1 Tax=Pithovirus LCPAC201 TaxID=2506591 RepID=A0A481Z690_9VIRU|nr:MAG: hypothetical protein LCPAC201_02130 [Pithovirus LCPAC201]